MKYKKDIYYLIKATYLDWNRREHILFYGKGLKFTEDEPDVVLSVTKASVAHLEERIPTQIYYGGLELSLIMKEVYEIS